MTECMTPPSYYSNKPPKAVKPIIVEKLIFCFAVSWKWIFLFIQSGTIKSTPIENFFCKITKKHQSEYTQYNILLYRFV